MNFRILKSVFVTVTSFLFLVPSALSSYLFKTIDVHSLEVTPEEYYADNVTDNAHFDDNVFDIYYFASPVYANYFASLSKEQRADRSVSELLDLATSSSGYESYVSAHFKEIQDDTNIVIRNINGTNATNMEALGYFLNEDGSKNFGYIKQSANGTLNPDFYNTVSRPVTGANDNGGWPVSFSGWTASLTNAVRYGYATQGDYDYVGSEDSLQALDETPLGDTASIGVTSSLDGSNVEIRSLSPLLTKGDKAIFLYPVFTTGKDYHISKVAENGFQSVVRIHNDEVEFVDRAINNSQFHNNGWTYFSREYYLAQEGFNNLASYSINNLYVEENSLLYLDFSPVRWNSDPQNQKDNSSGNKVGQHSGDWYSFGCTGTDLKTKDYAWVNSEGSNLKNGEELIPLFDTTGKVDHPNRKDALVNKSGIYNIYVYFNRSDNDSDLGKIGREGNSYDKLTLYDRAFVYFDELGTYSSRITSSSNTGTDYYSIELKIEKVYDFRLTGPNGSMNYASSKSRLVQLEDKTKMQSEAAVEAYYRVDGVRIESSAGKRFSEGDYSYLSSVFTILGSAESVCSFDAMDGNILKNFNQWSLENYHRKNEFSVAGTDKFYNLVEPSEEDKAVANKESLPFGADLDSSEYNFVNVQSSGEYDIAIYLVFNYVSSGTTAKKEIRMSKAYVAMARTVTSGVSVAIYESKDEVPSSKISGVTFSDVSEGWIGRINLEEGATFNDDSEVLRADKSTRVRFADFMKDYSDYSLYDCLTDVPLLRNSGQSIPIRKSYAAYLKKNG